MNYNDVPELISLGRGRRVMRFGNIAVKTANIWTLPKDTSKTAFISNERMNEINRASLKHEGLVYRHLGHVQGVIKPCKVSGTEIQMPCLHQGSLSGYLRAYGDTVDNTRRLRWVREAAHIICRIHERRVLVGDITTRNFLLDKNFALQVYGFTKSVFVSNDQDMANFSDTARFGSMMYEVISGSRYEFHVIPEIETDVAADPEPKTFKMWPTAELLPDTQNLFLGDIIRTCLLGGGFFTMQDVCHALDNAGKKPAASKSSGSAAKAIWSWRHVLRFAGPVATTVIFAGVIAPRLRLPGRIISAVLPSSRH